MREPGIEERHAEDGPGPSLRDFLLPLFRRRKLMALCFLGVLSGSIAAALLAGRKYESHFTVIVKRGRADPVVSSEAGPQNLQPAQLVAEEEVNSEVELLQSGDLLREVALISGLQNQQDSWLSVFQPRKDDAQTRLAKTVNGLAGQLHVEAVRKTNLIKVSYQSADPRFAYLVMTALANSYLEKHLRVNRPPGAFEFFQRTTEQYRGRLTEANMRLDKFNQEQHIANATRERDLVLQDLSKFDDTLHETETSIAETQRRISDLDAQLKMTPARITTAQKAADNGPTLQALQSNLAALEMKHTDMLAHYEPGYRPLTDLENQIVQAHKQLEAAKTARLKEDTTDVNPAYLWLKEELVKAQADLATLEGRSAATRRNVELYRERAIGLARMGLEQEGLIRDAKTDESNFLLYLNKQEEARISDALDKKRILNVAIAENPTVPSLPTHSPWAVVRLGLLLAMVVSTGSAFVADYFDSSFRTPDEVRGYLNLPVLASLPKHSDK